MLINMNSEAQVYLLCLIVDMSARLHFLNMLTVASVARQCDKCYVNVMSAINRISVYGKDGDSVNTR